MVRLRHVLSAAALLPALAGAALALPAVRQLAVEQLIGPPPVAVLASPEPVAAVKNSGVGWGVSIWPAQPTKPRSAPRAPAPPPPPPPPPLPWDTSSDSTSTLTPYQTPPLVLGPIIHLVQTVPEGGSVVIPPGPPGSGHPHILCAGPTTPLANYALDSGSPGAPRVRRYDFSGAFDFYYRYVSDSYLQTQPCS